MPGIRIPDPALPGSGKQSVQSLGGEAAGCWEGQGVLAGNGLREMGRCQCCEGASRKDGEGGGQDGAGHDGRGRAHGHTPS